MAETTFTFRVDDGLKAKFTKAAKARDRLGSQLLRDFMRDFVKRSEAEAQYDAWFRQQVDQSIDAANSGRTVPHDKVEDEFAARRMKTLSKTNASR